MMKLLLVHNYYEQPGGEDQSFAAEAALLRDNGHEVTTYTLSNDAIGTMPLAAAAVKTIWNKDAYRAIRAVIRKNRPDLAHFHNTFPLVSPAGYYAAKAEGVAVVQSLHNYRLLCGNAVFFRNGAVCEDCLGGFPWPVIAHACYRNDRAASAVVAGMQSIHRGLGTWRRQVDVFIAPSEFSRRKFIEGGLPAAKIRVKPNFLTDRGTGKGEGNYALFVGRLSPEKGLGTLIAAWERLSLPVLPLRIVGDGPVAPMIAQAAAHFDSISWLGRLSGERVAELMRSATFLIFPSECYETFGLVAIEAFAAGTPVIAANIGAMSELVEHGRTGFHFRPTDVDDLARQVEHALAHPDQLSQMRKEVRREFEGKYTASRNYEMMKGIYKLAVENAKSG
jgi:glycosyltransferase involved in cell wall biosynthesis